jgi:hypothetical protein
MLFSAAIGRGKDREMETNGQELKPREQAYLEHVRRAKEQGLTLKDYCEKLGLNVRSLYGVRRDLMEKGILPRVLAPKTQTKTRAKASGKFVAVRVATLPEAGGGEPACRVRHPSGWLIECSRMPEAAWVSELLQGGGDASA